MQHVLVGVDDEHWGEGAAVAAAEAVKRHGARREWVGEGVVHGGARRQRQVPHLVEQRRAQGIAGRARRLGRRGVLASGIEKKTFLPPPLPLSYQYKYNK